jgi:hypothetical protein
MEASQHSLLAACFTLHSINATLAIVPQSGAGLWKPSSVNKLIANKPITYMALHFSAFQGIFRGSTVKGTCFAVAKDLGKISFTVLTTKEVKFVIFNYYQ